MEVMMAGDDGGDGGEDDRVDGVEGSAACCRSRTSLAAKMADLEVVEGDDDIEEMGSWWSC